MPRFLRIASVSELPPPGEAKEFSLGDKLICVANLQGRPCAMDNVCLHRGGPLGQGVVEDGKVICPWHGWQWDPKTGASSENPRLKVARHTLWIEGDDVFVES